MDRFPEGFFCIGGRDFVYVYKHRPEFVEFTLGEMNKPKGLFRKWKDFCKQKKKEEQENGKST